MQSEQLTQKVAHTLKLRLLTVKKRRELGPDMVRITLEGSDLEGFYTPGFDDHVKLIFPDPATKELRLPQMGDRGMVFAAGQEKPPSVITRLACSVNRNLRWILILWSMVKVQHANGPCKPKRVTSWAWPVRAAPFWSARIWIGKS